MDPWVVLKKQYLDEKCLQRLPPKNAGYAGYTANSSSLIGLEQAKIIYGSTGGFGSSDSTLMPPPQRSHVTASSSYASYDSMNGHNVPVCTTPNGQTISTYSPQVQAQYPPPNNIPSYGSQYNYPTSINTYNSNNSSSSGGGTRTHFLDGQGWYNQTASRAVNQVGLFYILLHCIASHCIALHCITLHYITLNCITLNCIALHCIALHCIALNCITLH